MRTCPDCDMIGDDGRTTEHWPSSHVEIISRYLDIFSYQICVARKILVDNKQGH